MARHYLRTALAAALAAIFILIFSGPWPGQLEKASGLLGNFSFRLLALSFALFIAAVFYGWGAVLCRAAGWEHRSPMMRWILRFYAGYFVCGLLVYLLGFTGFMRPWLFQALAVMGFVACVHHLGRPRRILYLDWSTRLGQFASGALVLLVLQRLGASLNYDAFGDPLYYSLPAGLDYLKHGGFVWVPFEELYFQAGLGDMNLVYFHAVGSSRLFVQFAAQAFYCMVVTATMISGVLYFLRKFMPQAHALALAAAFTFPDIFQRIANYAKPDLMLGVLSVLVLVLVWECFHTRRGRTLRTLGIFVFMLSALMANIKLTAAFFIPPVCLAVLWELHAKKALDVRTLLVLAGSGLLACVNLAKNHLIFKNPILPGGSALFPSPYFSADYSELHKGSFYYDEAGVGAYLFNLLLHYQGFYAVILLGALAAGLHFAARRKNPAPTAKLDKRFIALIVATVLFGIILWIIGMPGSIAPARFLVSIIYALALLAFGGFAIAIQPWKAEARRRILNWAAAVVLLASVLNSLADVNIQLIRRGYAAESPHRQFVEAGDEQAMIDYLNQKQFKGLLVGHNLQNRFHAGFETMMARHPSIVTGFLFKADISALVSGLQALGADYYYAESSNEPQPPLLNPELVKAYLPLEKNIGRAYLFRVP